MNVKVVSLYEFDGDMEPGRWYDSLICCPSQCYCHKEANGAHYVLYLRWRHDDPWHGYIVAGTSDERGMGYGQWTDDLFLLNCLEYGHDEVPQAKEELERLFEEMYLRGAE